jgi:hypothetical protein
MIALKSMAVEMPKVAGHPNRRAFRGVLTTVDAASQRSPSGARGHLVVLTKRAAEQALPSLLGMALDYAPTLDRHDVRRKVGVITRAEIVGRNLEVGGYLFAKDFPEIVKEIGQTRQGIEKERFGGLQVAARAAEIRIAGEEWAEIRRFRSSLRAAAKRIETLGSALLRETERSCAQGFCRTIRAETPIAMAGESGLGLSYEVTEVALRDSRAQVWMLERVTFTGAAILRRNKAAYADTWIELCTE